MTSISTRLLLMAAKALASVEVRTSPSDTCAITRQPMLWPRRRRSICKKARASLRDIRRLGLNSAFITVLSWAAGSGRSLRVGVASVFTSFIPARQRPLREGQQQRQIIG
ncbi:hypothetical protein D3C81_1712840 [compost metagenome]